MLDANEFRRRLVLAMDNDKNRVSSAALADACKVTPQAVNGWRKTGRVAKKHIPTIAAMTKRPLEFFLGADDGIGTAYGMSLELAEAEAIKRLRDALPEWRRYVISLAMTTDQAKQRLFLDMLSDHVPDHVVEEAYGDAPHATRRKVHP